MLMKGCYVRHNTPVTSDVPPSISVTCTCDRQTDRQDLKSFLPTFFLLLLMYTFRLLAQVLSPTRLTMPCCIPFLWIVYVFMLGFRTLLSIGLCVFICFFSRRKGVHADGKVRHVVRHHLVCLFVCLFVFFTYLHVNIIGVGYTHTHTHPHTHTLHIDTLDPVSMCVCLPGPWWLRGGVSHTQTDPHIAHWHFGSCFNVCRPSGTVMA
jgi:hypothetical protein